MGNILKAAEEGSERGWGVIEDVAAATVNLLKASVDVVDAGALITSELAEDADPILKSTINIIDSSGEVLVSTAHIVESGADMAKGAARVIEEVLTTNSLINEMIAVVGSGMRLIVTAVTCAGAVYTFEAVLDPSIRPLKLIKEALIIYDTPIGRRLRELDEDAALDSADRQGQRRAITSAAEYAERQRLQGQSELQRLKIESERQRLRDQQRQRDMQQRIQRIGVEEREREVRRSAVQRGREEQRTEAEQAATLALQTERRQLELQREQEKDEARRVLQAEDIARARAQTELQLSRVATERERTTTQEEIGRARVRTEEQRQQRLQRLRQAGVEESEVEVGEETTLIEEETQAAIPEAEAEAEEDPLAGTLERRIRRRNQ